MTESDKPRNESPSLMAVVASIVEAALDGQPLGLLPQRLSRWKSAHRVAVGREQAWRTLGWNRL